ncbi:MAG TPA: (2Fe-2S) ferredoxin domain-containing protein [Chloroflexota bacterium]|jgi:(2Fe-2S) ferredoxin|nr:(2Fe-2S) ferredoxin domain-containing protein [Chloroflexota bacterium]
MENGEQAERWAFVCEASSCLYQGAAQTRESLVRAVAEQGDARVHVVRTGCLGLCGAGPAVVTYPAADVLLRVQPADTPHLAVALAGGTAVGPRAVRAPQWYRDRITSRLGYVIQLLRRRWAAQRTEAGSG